MSSPSHAPLLPYCRNCHYTLSTPRPRHCGHCGQETDLHPPSVREMVTEYLGHYVALDGPLWRTLWALIALPGHLTLAYFHGRRRHYVLPLRVYLSASFVFFVGWALLPTGPNQVVETAHSGSPGATRPAAVQLSPDMTPAQAAALAEAASRGASAPPLRAQGAPLQISSRLDRCDEARPASCSAVSRGLTRVLEKAQSMSFSQWMSRIRALAPYAMLAMQPLFAALLLLVLAGRGRRYAEHFVFSLHAHSLWLLALLMALSTHLEGPILFAVFGHGLVALRRVYGLGAWGTLWRGLVLSALYFALLIAVAVALVLLIASTA